VCIVCLELIGYSVEELEVELRRKEKELYLCSRLGLFLAQEVEELVSQRRGLLSDHTRLLLELHNDRGSKRDYLDINGAAEQVSEDKEDLCQDSAVTPSEQHSSAADASGDAKAKSQVNIIIACELFVPLHDNVNEQLSVKHIFNKVKLGRIWLTWLKSLCFCFTSLFDDVSMRSIETCSNRENDEIHVFRGWGFLFCLGCMFFVTAKKVFRCPLIVTFAAFMC